MFFDEQCTLMTTHSPHHQTPLCKHDCKYNCKFYVNLSHMFWCHWSHPTIPSVPSGSDNNMYSVWWAFEPTKVLRIGMLSMKYVHMDTQTWM
jgi:hypothetical protein